MPDDVTAETPPGRYFSWAELTRSTAAALIGDANEPGPEERHALRLLCQHVLDPVRARLGVPVRPTSGYRSPAVNAAIKGSKTSQHMKGEAADIKAAHVPAVDLATVIVHAADDFDQVIWYAPERGGHVHVSYAASGRNRRQTLHAPASGGYSPWSPPPLES